MHVPNSAGVLGSLRICEAVRMRDDSDIKVRSKKAKDTSPTAHEDTYHTTAKYKGTASDSFPDPRISGGPHVIEKAQFPEERKTANTM